MAKSVIVTGASGNMGHAVVEKFLEEDYQVIGTVIPNDPVPLEIRHPRFEKVVVDLLNEKEAGEFVQSRINTNGGIDVAVLTVGGFAMGKIETTSITDIQKQYRLNFETAYNVCRPVFVQMMKQKTGRIFLVGSRPGLDTRHATGTVAYGLAKSLIFRLAEIMNEEAIGSNVVTTVLIPSTIDTPQNRKAMPDADFSKWVQPAAIAENIFFQCTEAASVLREPILKLYGNA